MKCDFSGSLPVTQPPPFALETNFPGACSIPSFAPRGSALAEVESNLKEVAGPSAPAPAALVPGQKGHLPFLGTPPAFSLYSSEH